MMMAKKTLKGATINLLKRDTAALEPAAKRPNQSKLDSDRFASVALVMQALCVIVQKLCEYALPQASKGFRMSEKLVYHPFRIIESRTRPMPPVVAHTRRLPLTATAKCGIVPEAA